MNERDAERERRAAQYEDAVEAGAVLPLPEGVQYPDEEMAPEYDFSGGVRGKHHKVPRVVHFCFEIDERGSDALPEDDR